MAKNSKKKAKAQKKHKQAAAATAKNEGETPPLSNGLAPATTLSVGVEPRAGKLLAANKQRAIVAQLLKQADAHGLRVGDKRFVVAAKWWERWCQYVGFDDANDSEDTNDTDKNANNKTKSNSAQKPTNQISNGASHLTSPPSKLNNLPLLQLPPPTDGPQLDALMGAPLRPQLKEGYHYTLVPEEVWDALLVWYGGGPAIARFVVEVGDPTLGNAFKRVEVYPELSGQQEEEETEEQKEEETSPAVETKTTLVRKPSASSSIPKICGACRATTGSLKRCGKCQVVWYCGAACQTAHWKFHKAVCRAPSASEDSEVVIHERMGHERRGKMGLRNLGNTCFMNSALQCLSHVEILTKYFLSNNYLKDLNRDNPLGTGGNLAVEYDSLLKELWFGSTTSTAPSSLKRAIGRFAPQFSGFQQHDSQELLAYILDGLHEDLNRVKQKPYTEVKESDGKQDDALVAKEAWERHLLRNDSIFVDHIQGQFKSTVVCPICAKVSITFDPYNCIQLELPIQQTRRMDAIVVPLGKPMKRYSVDVPKKGTVLALKRAVSKLCGLAANVMIAVDIYHSMVYRVIGDSERVARLRDEDRIVLYEVEPPVTLANDQDEPPQIYYGFLYHRADTALTGDPLLFTFYADTTCQEMLEMWSKMIEAHVTYQSGDSSATSIPPEVLSPCVFLGNRDGAFLRAEPVPASATSRFIDYATLQPNDSLDDIVYVSVAWSPTLLASPSAANYRPDVEFVLDHESVQLKDSQSARGDGISLYDCFRNFTKPETLDQANLWYCSKCKEHRQARKTMEIWKLPDVLIVSLKRFEYRNEVLRDKLDVLVDFPLDGLDMAPFCLEPTSDAERLTYDLFAVSNHYGSMGFGHYTAFARSWQDGNGEAYPGWYSFDDSQVSPAMAGQVQSNAAYILFYKRRRMTTPGKT